MADGNGGGDDEQQAEAVRNEIPNDCNMATELVPKEIENDHREYRLVYQMASPSAKCILVSGRLQECL